VTQDRPIRPGDLIRVRAIAERMTCLYATSDGTQADGLWFSGADAVFLVCGIEYITGRRGEKEERADMFVVGRHSGWFLHEHPSAFVVVVRCTDGGHGR